MIIYKYKDYEYKDETGQVTLAQMQDHLREYFPELAEATTKSSQLDNGDTVIEFVKSAGTKAC